MTNKISNIIKTFLLVSIMLLSIVPLGNAQSFDGVYCSNVYTSSSEVYVGQDVSLEAVLDNDRGVDYGSLSVDWDFGDNDFEINGGTKTTKKYDTAGSYTVTAEVSGLETLSFGGLQSFSVQCFFPATVTVKEIPEFKLTLEDAEVYENIPITLTAQNDFPLALASELIYSWKIDDGTTEQGVTGKSLTKTFDTAKDYKVKVTATHSSGKTSEDTATVTVKKINSEGPIVDLVASSTLTTVDDAVIFTVYGADDESDTLSFDLAVDGNSIQTFDKIIGTLNGNTFDFQVTSQPYTFEELGTHTVTVTGTNKFGEKAPSKSITVNVVDLPNSRPVAFATSDVYFGTSALDINLDGSDSFDPEGKDLISYEWTITNRDNPSFVEYEFGEFVSYTLNEPGVYDVGLVVTDDDFATSDTFTMQITVTQPLENFAPVIPSIANQTAYKGEFYTQSIYAYDVYDPDITYSATGLPDGLSIKTVKDNIYGRNIGVISGTPTKLGDNKVKLTVTDTQGLSSEETFFINVRERPKGPREKVNGLVVTRANLNKVYFNVGELLTTNIKLENDGTEDFEDLKITASIGQLGVLKTYTVRELNNDNSNAQLLGLEIPSYAPNGEYSVTISVSNDDIRRTLHRTFWIID